MELENKLILGTANFGQAYGFNRSHDMNPHDIMDEAWGLGIRVLDTASNYGASEEVISKHLKNNPDQDWRVISKFELTDNWYDQIDKSLNLLGDHLKMVLVHNYNGQELNLGSYPEFEHLAFGASTYGESLARKASEKFPFLQIEFNLLNRYAYHAVPRGQSQLMLRSIFQKGFLTNESFGKSRRFHEHPDYNTELLVIRTNLKMLCEDIGITLEELALRYVSTMTHEFDMYVVGASDSGQLTTMTQHLSEGPLDHEVIDAVHEITSGITPEYVDLRLWES